MSTVSSLNQYNHYTSQSFEICKNSSRFEESLNQEIKSHNILHRWHEKNIFEQWKDFPKIFIPKENISEKCAADVDKLLRGAENLNLWALKSEFELN